MAGLGPVSVVSHPAITKANPEKCCKQGEQIRWSVAQQFAQDQQGGQGIPSVFRDRLTYLLPPREQIWPQSALGRKLLLKKMRLPKNVAVQVSGCRECLRLLLPLEGGRDITCIRCEQVENLLSIVAKLKEI